MLMQKNLFHKKDCLLQQGCEKLFSTNIAISGDGLFQRSLIHPDSLLGNILQHFFFVLRQGIQIVHQVNQQEFRGGEGGKPVLDPEIEFLVAQSEFPMPLVIVHHPGVV